jgi:cytochrome oxidase Cu insertion factor (SCO1/SenC/PrrC family)
MACLNMFRFFNRLYEIGPCGLAVEVAMIRFSRKLMLSLLTCGALAATVSASANEVNTGVSRAADFTLIDQHGKAFNLHYHAQRPAVLLMAHTAGSGLVQQSL